MINKYKYLKSNAKKLLHKIGKHWAVVTVSMLAFCAFGAPIHSDAHASNISNAQPKVQRTITQRKPSINLKQNINKQSSKVARAPKAVRTANTRPVVQRNANQQKVPAMRNLPVVYLD